MFKAYCVNSIKIIFNIEKLYILCHNQTRLCHLGDNNNQDFYKRRIKVYGKKDESPVAGIVDSSG